MFRSANVSVSGFSSQVQPCFTSVRSSVMWSLTLELGPFAEYVIRDPGAEVQDDPRPHGSREHLLQDGEGLADAAVPLPLARGGLHDGVDVAVVHLQGRFAKSAREGSANLPAVLAASRSRADAQDDLAVLDVVGVNRVDEVGDLLRDEAASFFAQDDSVVRGETAVLVVAALALQDDAGRLEVPIRASAATAR